MRKRRWKEGGLENEGGKIRGDMEDSDQETGRERTEVEDRGSVCVCVFEQKRKESERTRTNCPKGPLIQDLI